MHAEPVLGLPLHSASLRGQVEGPVQDYPATRDYDVNGPLWTESAGPACKMGVRLWCDREHAAARMTIVIVDVEVDLFRHCTLTMAIPAFLVSGASSRAHHALIVALHNARSAQEEHTIAAAEVQRVRSSFTQPASTVRD